MGAGVADRMALGQRRPWERKVVTPAELPQSPNSYPDRKSEYVRQGLQGGTMRSIAGGEEWYRQRCM